MVVKPSGIPLPGTERALLCMFTCNGKRPVSRAARLGEQNLYVYSLSSSTPVATKLSIFGVTTSGEGPDGEAARW